MTPAAARIALTLFERDPMPVVDLALAVEMRRSVVRDLLAANPACFSHNGRRRRASRWSVQTFDVVDAAKHFGVSAECAEGFLYGESGFLELGFVTSLNGDGGPLVVTAPGVDFSNEIQTWLPAPSEPARLPALPPTPARGGVSARKESAYV